MGPDRTYIQRNSTERERLRALVGRLSDEDLRRPLAAGWTVAGVLGHLTFWDQRILVLLERWQRGVMPRLPSQEDIDWINDSAKTLCLALPPRVAAQLALSTADAVDRTVEALTDDRLAANTAAGSPINVLRAEHRRQHLEEIERALRS